MKTKRLNHWANYLLTLAVLSMPAAFAAGFDQGPVQGPVQDELLTPYSGLEVGGGVEMQVMEQFSHCTTHCGDSNWSNNKARSGGILEIGFKGIQQSYLFEEGAKKAVLIPISIQLDSDAHSASFGRVKDFEKQKTRIRQVTGALVESVMDPGTGMLQVRGKLVRATFDRDKGLWDWRILDASIGVSKAWMSTNGNFMVDMNVQVGSGIGGVHLNGLAAVEKALNIAPVADVAYTVTPFAMMSAAVQFKALKIEWVTTGERRIDLTRSEDQATFAGNRLKVSSHHLNSALDMEFILSRLDDDNTGSNGRRLSLFVRGQYDLDELTISRMFFRNGEDFRSFTVIGGVRAQF